MGTVIVKIGGSLAGKHLDVLATMVKTLSARQFGVVLVHGGGPRISEALAQTHLEMPWHDGQRVTSTAAVKVVRDVLCRQVNREITQTLTETGVTAAGVCGADGVIVGTLLPELQRTADVNHVVTNELLSMLQSGKIPVVAPVGRAEDGDVCNINADLAAASIAKALSADRLVFLTDVDGIYYDWDNKKKITDTSGEELSRWLAEGAFTAGMIPKVRAVLRSLTGSVHSAYIVNGSDGEAVMAAALKLEEEPWNNTGGTRIVNRMREE